MVLNIINIYNLKDLSKRVPDYYLKGELKNNLFLKIKGIFNIMEEIGHQR